MKYVKVAVIIALGLFGVAFLMFKDYEFETGYEWPPEIKVYSNPITSRIRVVDASDNTTLFSYSVDAFAKPVDFQKVDNKWIVTFEKR